MVANPLSTVRVLIADDQPLMRKLVLEMLNAWGFSDITICCSGREAIEIATCRCLDLIISDWRMLDLDGIDLLHALRSSPDPLIARSPFIFLTGNAELGDVKAARDAGMNEYLIKPFTAAELMRRIRSVIEHPRCFVKSPYYRGPDRRRRKAGPPEGNERRQELSHAA